MKLERESFKLDFRSAGISAIQEEGARTRSNPVDGTWEPQTRST